MNNEEAKFILSAYRPGGQDAQDPRFQEALRQARNDPELTQWLESERAIDSRIGVKLKSGAKPPAHLKASLLAQRKIVRPAAWWQQPTWLATAAAAGLALIATVGLMLFDPTPESQFVDYRDTMTEFAASKMERLDLESHELDQVRHWLTQADAHGNFVLPEGLNGRPSLGCRLLEWNDHKVSLICFALKNQQMAHLIIIDRNAFDNPPSSSPQFAHLGDAATVAWSIGNKTYLIASTGATEQELVTLL